MRAGKRNRADRDRFWLIVLGTVVLAFFGFFAAAGGGWTVESSLGKWPGDVFMVMTAALGVYSIGLLYRGRVGLAAMGFLVFAIGAVGNFPVM